MKNLFYLLFLLFYVSTFSQKKLNSYQYIIVSDKFDFFKSSDKYQTSSLTKFLFNKKGYITYLASDEKPTDVTLNNCLALSATIKDSSGMFATETVIELRDCNNKLLFTSKKGKSRKKEYKSAYHQAIREAFKDVRLKAYKKSLAVLSSPKTTSKTIKGIFNKNATTIYAQPIPNGFQLVDATPKVVYTILHTSTKNLFIIKDKNGILYLKKSKWIAEFYESGKLIQKVLQIKF